MTSRQPTTSFKVGQRFGDHPDDGQYPGRLIIVEGIDGSGKSTQLDLLGKWLRSLGYVTVFTEWNSSPIVRRTTKRGKDERLLTPMSFSLIHAADFASRVYTQIMPALKSGTVVLADRYVYTAFARDAARGVNPDWLRRVYSFAVRPSLALYFKVPLEESIRRIVSDREEPGYYESGQDLGVGVQPGKVLPGVSRAFAVGVRGPYRGIRPGFHRRDAAHLYPAANGAAARHAPDVGDDEDARTQRPGGSEQLGPHRPLPRSAGAAKGLRAGCRLRRVGTPSGGNHGPTRR